MSGARRRCATYPCAPLCATQSLPRAARARRCPPPSAPRLGDVHVLSHNPLIVRVENFIREAEVAELLRIGTPLLARSRLESSDGAGNVSLHRTSTTAFIDGEAAFSQNVINVLKRASVFTGLDWRHSENLQLVQYARGERFAPHCDWFKPHDFTADGSGRGRRPGGQRVYSCLIYLNDEFEGGATHFPALNITVQPRARSALLFRNVDASAALGRRDNPRGQDGDARTIHEGRAVLSGQKLVANLWVLEQPFETYRAAERAELSIQ